MSKFFLIVFSVLLVIGTVFLKQKNGQSEKLESSYQGELPLHEYSVPWQSTPAFSVDPRLLYSQQELENTPFATKEPAPRPALDRDAYNLGYEAGRKEGYDKAYAQQSNHYIPYKP